VVKKALIITYYWPPSGGVGVQRWLKFAKYLPEYGWQPVIYTPQNPDFEIKDESLLLGLAKDLEVLKQPIWEPFSAYRRLLGKQAVQKQGVVGDSPSLLSRLAVWLRGNYFIPDSRVFWVRPSANFLSRYLKNSDIDLIITTGPPHSIHLIGLELKKRTGISWLADFRDPWSRWDVLDQLKLTEKSRRSHLRLENSVLSNADVVLTVSPTLEQSLLELGAKTTCLVTNGYDDEVLPEKNSLPEKFRISHLGLLNRGRNPEVLWDVLDDLCSQDTEFHKVLEIYLAGTVENSVLDSIAAHSKLNDKLINAGYRTHKQIMLDYQQSAMLLLLINKTSNANWILPGKMFEYIAQNKAILALGSPEGDASKVLQQAGYANCLAFDDYSTIRKQVLDAYHLFKAGKARLEPTDIRKFHRKELTGALAACLDKLK
jgi:glycosyltransferase involved in cell wall biosynthesis